MVPYKSERLNRNGVAVIRAAATSIEGWRQRLHTSTQPLADRTSCPTLYPNLTRSLPSLTQRQSRHQFRPYRNRHQHFEDSIRPAINSYGAVEFNPM